MKLAIIGANGRLGSKIAQKAIERKIDIICFDFGESKFPNQIEKSLFEISSSDISECDVLVSAFGSGIHTDPSVNYKAYETYKKLCLENNLYLVAIAGAGCLYTDHSHSLYEYQSEKHPEKLRGISYNNLKGIELLKNTPEMDWCAVCPSRNFDFDGPLTKDYIIGIEEEIIYNQDGNSYVSYEDLAEVMLDVAQEKRYHKQVITVSSAKGGN